MSFGTFVVTIDGTQIGGLAETRARLTVVANTGTLKDPEGNKFRFPRPRGMSIGLPYSLVLDTDVTTGESEAIGYEVTVVTDAGGRITSSFAAQAAGSTIALTDLTETIIVPVSEATRLRDETITAHDEVVALFATFNGVVTPQKYGALADGVHDDTSAIQDAIDFCPEGGLVYLPGGFYKLTDAPVVDKSITLMGAGVSALGGPFTTYGFDKPRRDSILTGTVLVQTGAGKDGLLVNVVGSTVNLRNFGVRFDGASVRDTNTGHGVNCTPSATYLGGHDHGIFHSTIENVYVYGHDGNHHAFHILNPILVTMNNVRGFGGGGLYVECDAFTGNYGNMLIQAPYFYLGNVGTADAIDFRARASGGATGMLNLITLVRPQCNAGSAAATASTQYLFTVAKGGALPKNIAVITPDFEPGAGANKVNFGGKNSGTIVARGGLISAPIDPATNGYSTENGYQAFSTPGTFTFVVPHDVYEVRYRCYGPGGGGGGAGSNASAAAQAGAGGGGAGAIVEGTLPTSPNATLTLVVGAAGVAGIGGATSGANGTSGSQGGQTTINSDVKALGGGGGASTTGNQSTNGGNGGIYARTGTLSAANIPGFGGPGGSTGSGIGGVPGPGGAVPGAGGGAASATAGGLGGGGVVNKFTAGTHTGGGAAGGSGTTAGTAGTTALMPGCGGGGGGGGTAGAVGGSGGTGGPGQIELWW